MCNHSPKCPAADATDHDAARIIAAHPEQGWYLLCGGTIIFTDHGELTAAGVAVPPPHRNYVPPQRALAPAPARL